MARLRIGHNSDEDNSGKWHVYAEDDGEGAVRFKLADFTRTATTTIDRRVKDKAFIESLNIEWDKLPKGSGNRKLELRTIVTADYVIRDWENVDGYDGTPDCNLVNKMWAWERMDLALWMMEKAQSGGAELVAAEAGN